MCTAKAWVRTHRRAAGHEPPRCPVTQMTNVSVMITYDPYGGWITISPTMESNNNIELL